MLIRSWFQPDDHNNPTFLVLPDERVMIFYSRHTDEPCFYYRISNKPGDITDLGPELKIETQNNTTYPSPFILSDDPEHFYLCWRGISWHPTIAQLSIPDANGKVDVVWGPKQIVQSSADRPYAKYVGNGKDKIYMAYTTGHPDPTMPNYLYLNYIDINSKELKDIQGETLARLDQEQHHVAATEDYQQQYGHAVVHPSQLRDWLWQVVLDKNDWPAIALVQINEDKSSHDYYYTRWTGSEWQKTFLTNAGGHFHQSPDIEKCYSGGMAIDDQNPNEVYCTVPVEGKYGEVYELIKYTIDHSGVISKTDTLTRDSKLNNVRPFVVLNRNSSPLRLTWMYGNYYDWIVSKTRPLGFSTSIFSDYDLGQTVHPESGRLEDWTSGSNEKQKRSFSVDSLREFTIFLDLTLDTSGYSGTLVRSGDFEYAVDEETMKPVINYQNVRYQSTNKLGNSDQWKHERRSTGGNWYQPVKYTSVDLTLVYANGELTTYVNGLVDQVVTTENLSLAYFEIGRLATEVNRCKVYGRKLNVSEIQYFDKKN